MTECYLADTAATEAYAAGLAQQLAQRKGGVIYLHGDLGAGKTTLVRALLRALGVTGPIKSPTYTLVEPYQVASFGVLHMDLYRLSEPEEFYSLGVVDDDPADCWWLIEWPERAAGALPSPNIELFLRYHGAGRMLRCQQHPV